MAEVYLEEQIVGGVVRLAAIDAATGIEVVILAPASASRAEMERVVLAKLKRAIAREQGAAPETCDDETKKPPRPGVLA